MSNYTPDFQAMANARYMAWLEEKIQKEVVDPVVEKHFDDDASCEFSLSPDSPEWWGWKFVECPK